MTQSKGWYLRADIVRWVDEDFPEFVDARFTDRFGREWSVVDKAAVIAPRDFWTDTPLPQPIVIACTIVAQGRDDAGRDFAEISTEPWGIETEDGISTFEVLTHQLTCERD